MGMRWISTGLGWLLLGGLLVVAINLKSPYLFAFRVYEGPVLLIASSILMVVYGCKTRGIQRALACGVLLAVLSLTLWGEAVFRYRKDAVLDGNMPGARQLGAHFVVGYDQVQALKPLIRQGLIGGIFVTRRNAAGKSREALRSEIAALQQIRVDAGLPLLIVATDQEGGIVAHVSPPLERQPPLSALIESSSTHEALIANAQAYGQTQGQALTSLGITVNFSPVVDLKPNRAASRLDFHSLIEKRAISADPILTIEVASAYVQGLRSQGVRGTLKHFPGLGSVPGDTHHFSAQPDVALAQLQARDWLPFKEVARQSDALIMVGHVVLPEVDGENPASFSKAVVQGIIRNDWGHQGVVVTDDLTMRAAYSHGFCTATVKALNAGVDLLLISYDYEKFYEMMYCANQAYESGQLDKAALQASHKRLLDLHRAGF